MSDITREQYENAVMIRDDGYSCGLQCPGCRGCPLQVVECGISSGQGEGHDTRIAAIDSVISTYEAEHPEEFRNALDHGEGWRLLRDNETIKTGDEFYDDIMKIWFLSGDIGKTPAINGLQYRRRVTKPPRVYDYRDVDLPEVQALIGKQVYMRDCLRSITENNQGGLVLFAIDSAECYPYRDVKGGRWQFIRAIDSPKISLTRAELIAIAAKSRGVKPEQIEVEE